MPQQTDLPRTCWGCRHCFNGFIPITRDKHREDRMSSCRHEKARGQLINVDNPPPAWCPLRKENAGE